MPQQPDARETRVFASEVKFVVPAELGAAIRDWARQRLSADPYGGGPFGDEYHTSSLYFDTRALDVFHRRGSFGRCKYRVRRYGEADLIFFERKLRKPRLLIKRRTAGTVADLDRLDAGAVPRNDWRGHWFHRRLLARRLQPACQISYHRMARVMINGHGPARLTLDDEIRSASVDALRFTATPGIHALGGFCVLEVKYRLETPAIFKELVEQFALRTTTVSKYRLGMAALGHVAGGNAPRRSAGGESAYA